jgi:hypothetical protein
MGPGQHAALEAPGIDRDVHGVAPIIALNPTGSEILSLQRSAGNAAVGRLLRAGMVAPPPQGRMLMRFPGPTAASCDQTYGSASDVLYELQRRSDLIRNALPQATIANQADLDGYLNRWWDSTGCIELAVSSAKYASLSQRHSDQAKAQYAEALKIILVRAEDGMHVKRTDLITRNSANIRTDAVAALTTYGSLDRFDRLSPSAGYASTYILKTLNPKALNFVSSNNDACTANCPLTAVTMQTYLATGTINTIQCDPSNQGPGYLIQPDPDTQWGGQRPWAAAFKALQPLLSNHGDFAVVEGDRRASDNTPAAIESQGITRYHYFNVVNIRGTLYYVDAFSGAVGSDLAGYVSSLQTVRHRFTQQRLTATSPGWSRALTSPSGALAP